MRVEPGIPRSVGRVLHLLIQASDLVGQVGDVGHSSRNLGANVVGRLLDSGGIQVELGRDALRRRNHVLAAGLIVWVYAELGEAIEEIRERPGDAVLAGGVKQRLDLRKIVGLLLSATKLLRLLANGLIERGRPGALQRTGAETAIEAGRGIECPGEQRLILLNVARRVRVGDVVFDRVKHAVVDFEGLRRVQQRRG